MVLRAPCDAPWRNGRCPILFHEKKPSIDVACLQTACSRVRQGCGRAALVNHSLDGGVRLKDPRNRPSGDPNCELFPQGPIIPVPPSSSPYRPVGICGNNWAVSPDRHAKESLRTREFGGSYSRYFAGGFVLRRCRNSIRRYSAAPKREFRSQFPLFPLDG